MSDQIIQASEIGEYVYCQRAWWLRRSMGYRSQNVEELTAGTRYHQAHAVSIIRATWVQKAALALIFLVISLIVFWLAGVL